ncbi:MAG TPA: hypothetical protein DHU81_09320 [Hyphomonas sp.]|nr:hypothetical protein [Hyphomonas sp.]
MGALNVEGINFDLFFFRVGLFVVLEDFAFAGSFFVSSENFVGLLVVPVLGSSFLAKPSI